MPWADHGRKSLFRPGISIIHNSTNRIKRHVPPLAGLVPLEVRRVALPDMEKPVMEKLIHTLATSFLLIALMIGAVYAQTWTSTSGPLRPHVVKDLSSAVSSGQTLYAADAETLKVSTNGGTTWNTTVMPITNPL